MKLWLMKSRNEGEITLFKCLSGGDDVGCQVRMGIMFCSDLYGSTYPVLTQVICNVPQ